AVLGLAVVQSAAAQTGSIGGTVRDESGSPVSAVQVQVEGETRGTLTDSQGRFLITGVPAGPRVVQARRIGFQTAEETASVTGNGLTEVHFILRSSPLALEAVVVTGQGGEISRR